VSAKNLPAAPKAAKPRGIAKVGQTILSVSSTPAPKARRFSSISAVKRTDMVATVLKSLTDRILRGQFDTEGLFPPEGELAASFGVSRTVIREAMRSLRAYGMIEVSQGRKPRIKPADPQAAIATLNAFLRRSGASPLALIEVRSPLESETAALAAARVQPGHLAGLEEAVRALRQAKTFEEGVEADLRFHRLLADATGNPTFGLLLDTLSGLMRESRRQTLARSGYGYAAQGHQRILEAVQAGDSTAARSAMLDHLRLAQKDLRND
jgi:GntR family transcriptional repressor for pyruvate dehydrogenase complex